MKNIHMTTDDFWRMSKKPRVVAPAEVVDCRVEERGFRKTGRLLFYVLWVGTDPGSVI